MKYLVLVAAALLIACGGTGTAPTPIAAPAPPSPVVAADPARFDAGFNAQLVHDAFEHPDSTQRAALLPSDPSIYLQSHGLTAAQVASIEVVARAVVPAMSGSLRHVAGFESGPEAKPPQAGWIVVDLVTDDSAPCGRSAVGSPAGHIWLNTVDRCRRNGAIIGSVNLVAHELGHALGFWHVADGDAMMNAVATRPLPNDKEQYHASLAYQSNGAYAAGGSFSTQRVMIAD